MFSSVFGALLMACGFTMRVVAVTPAAGGAMDLWLFERVEALEKQRKDEGDA